MSKKEILVRLKLPEFSNPFKSNYNYDYWDCNYDKYLLDYGCDNLGGKKLKSD